MTRVWIILTEITIIALVIHSRKKINTSIADWFRDNKFFVVVLTLLIIGIIYVDVLLFSPGKQINYDELISKAIELLISSVA